MGGIGVDGDNAAGPSANGLNGALPGPPAKLTVAQLEQQLKQQEKAAKRARKEAKKVSCCLSTNRHVLQHIDKLQGCMPVLLA